MHERTDDEPVGRIVVVFAKAFPPVLGGVETYSEQVVRAYLRRGYEVRVLTQTEGVVGWQIRASKDGEFHLWNAGAGGQLTVFGRMLRAARDLAKRNLDIAGVHSTTWRVGVVAEAIFSDLPRVITVHGREVLNFPRGTRRLMTRTLRRATVVLAVSGETLAIAVAAVSPEDPSHWHVAYNGLTDVDRAVSASRWPHDGPIRILSLCRLVARKNVARAVEAVASLDRKILDSIEFRIAGRGPELEMVQHAIDDRNVSDSVKLLGFVEDGQVAGLYDWADIFVHPQSNVGEGNDFEGFGIAIADAMGHGCAVVAGDAGGPKDFITDGETGLLVDGNDRESITRAIDRLARDPLLRTRVASGGRQFALANFSWDAHIARAVEAMCDVRGGSE